MLFEAYGFGSLREDIRFLNMGLTEKKAAEFCPAAFLLSY
jgi:hypothetical protein